FASRSRRFMFSLLSKYAVSFSDSISRHNSIGTITAVGSPLSSETYCISSIRNLQQKPYARKSIAARFDPARPALQFLTMHAEAMGIGTNYPGESKRRAVARL